jgi:hypothetical protein
MTPPNWGRSLAACMKELSQYLNGWVAHFRLCTAEAIKGLRAIDAHIRRRLRAIIIHHRKRPRFLFRHLRSRGACTWWLSSPHRVASETSFPVNQAGG